MADKKGYVAHAKFLMISPSKVRRVADVVRNQPYTDALALLSALPQKGAAVLYKVVKSAGSNALSLNKMLDEQSLVVKEIHVNDGPRMKRVWARGRGRRDLLLKRMSHISVTVDEVRKAGE